MFGCSRFTCDLCAWSIMTKSLCAGRSNLVLVHGSKLTWFLCLDGNWLFFVCGPKILGLVWMGSALAIKYWTLLLLCIVCNVEGVSASRVYPIILLRWYSIPVLQEQELVLLAVASRTTGWPPPRPCDLIPSVIHRVWQAILDMHMGFASGVINSLLRALLVCTFFYKTCMTAIILATLVFRRVGLAFWVPGIWLQGMFLASIVHNYVVWNTKWTISFEMSTINTCCSK